MQRNDYRRTDPNEPRRQPPGLHDERGLSDLVGFVIAFGVIVASIGIISTFGLNTLGDIRNNQQLQNAERSFIILSNNLNEIRDGRAEKRSSELQIGGGNIQIDRGFSFTIVVENTSAGPGGTLTKTDYDETIATGSLQYQLDDTIVSYQNGAMIRGVVESDGGALEIQPNFVCTADSAFVSLVKLEAPATTQLGGDGTVRVAGQENSTRIVYPVNRTESAWGGTAENGTHINVTVNSQFSGAWETYFTAQQNEWESVPSKSNTYSCEVGRSGEIYVKQTNTTIRLTP